MAFRANNSGRNLGNRRQGPVHQAVMAGDAMTSSKTSSNSWS